MVAPATNAGQAAATARPAAAVRATDDEILGIPGAPADRTRDADQLSLAFDADGDEEAFADSAPGAARSGAAGGREIGTAGADEPANLRAMFDANPELRAAWHEAKAYRESFATPGEAREATALLADVNRMDALFFSKRAEDHAELARAIADLDPAAFQSLARAINEYAGAKSKTEQTRDRESQSAAVRSGADANQSGQKVPAGSRDAAGADPVSRASGNEEPRANSVSSGPDGQAQAEFYHATNAATVQSVIDSIESQVERLLPEGISRSARTRVVGEIYRELDTTLRSNRQLASQMREAFRSGSLDEEHQRAIVSLITSRARQALPGVAKRVLNEWTSTLVSANQERRTRQRTAERRVDIAGSGGAGNDGRRSMSPRDVDYSRLSDADILNL